MSVIVSCRNSPQGESPITPLKPDGVQLGGHGCIPEFSACANGERNYPELYYHVVCAFVSELSLCTECNQSICLRI